MKRRLAWLLILNMLLLSLASCAEEQNEEAKKTDETAAAATETEVSEETEVPLNLPEGLDFEGHVFTILNNSYQEPGWTQRDIWSEGLDGTPINDAVFERNATVSDTYNCSVASMQELNVHDITRTLVTASDDSVDLITPLFWNGTVGNQILDGYFIDYKTVSSVDLTHPWYDQKSVEDLELMGRQYMMTTDLTIADEVATSGMVFNKKLYEDHQYTETYGDLYELVREGKWTLDTLRNMVMPVSNDLNGDGKMNDKDLYGLLYQRDSVPSFINGFDMRICEKGEDGLPMYSLINETNANKLDAMFDFLYNKDVCFHVMNFFDGSGTNFTTGMTTMFTGNKSMFMWIRFADVEHLRTMDVDFGIVPVPKYDEAQEQYYSAVNNFMGTPTVMPTSCYDTEKVGYFLEAISYHSRRLLTPAYYSVNLQGKISRDEASRDMLDLIFENRVFDIGAIYNFGGLSDRIYQMSTQYDSDYATVNAKGAKIQQKMLERFITKYEELGQ